MDGGSNQQLAGGRRVNLILRIIFRIRKGNKERGIGSIIESHPFKMVFKPKTSKRTDLSSSSRMYDSIV
jgi:hypothetical protein